MITQSWNRSQVAAYADRLLLSAREHADDSHARIHFPGGPGGYGHDVDGLEGFARTFIAAGIRIAGEQGNDPLDLAQWYAQGLDAGTDPGSSSRWVRLTEHSQAKVEAAAISLMLDMTRPWLWDQLDRRVQRNIISYLAPAVGDDTYPQINWVWFRLVVQSFLRSVDGPHSESEIRQDLATHDSFPRRNGWIADGQTRAYDHYAGWALHLFPILWARMDGVEDLVRERGEADRERLGRYLVDAVRLVGADGSPLMQGRSLTYRFAAAAPFWAGLLAGVDSVEPGMLRRAACRIIQHFADHGVPGDEGVLTTGWHHAWAQMLQPYSGPGSPYWASLGLLGLSLPEDHAAWSSPEHPLPSEGSDDVFTIEGPGWLVSSSGGIVRVHNHGTDHSLPGAASADDPLYARLTYSTATAPLMSGTDSVAPRESGVTVMHEDSRPSHRTGFATIILDAAEPPIGAAASHGWVHWLDSPDAASLTRAGHLTIVSLVHGPWEIRLVRALQLDPAALAIHVLGWPVAEGSSLCSTLTGLCDGGVESATTHEGASMLHPTTCVPSVAFPPLEDQWLSTLVALDHESHPQTGAEVSCRFDASRLTITALWPDGHQSTTTLALPSTQAIEGLDHPQRRTE